MYPGQIQLTRILLAESSRARLRVRAIIPAFEGTQAAFADSYPGMDLQVFLDATEYAKPLPVSKNSAAWNALEAKLLPDAFSGDVPVDVATTDLAEQMTALLAKE